MSQWVRRAGWPDDPFGHTYLLRAIDLIGAAKLGERWRPPLQLTEETAAAAGECDRAWTASEEFLNISRLVADCCATGELDAVRFDGARVIPMDANEWLMEHSRERDACFKMGHVYLADGAWPVYLRRGSLEKFIAGLIPPAPAKPGGQRGPPVRYDWDEGFQFMRQELGKRGDPRDPLNKVDGWRVDADVARLVAAHLARDGREPDQKHVERVIRPELETWRKEQK
jgi:hypothetical protein